MKTRAMDIAGTLAWVAVGVCMLGGLVLAICQDGTPEWQGFVYWLIAGTPVRFMVFALVLYPLLRLFIRR